MRNFTLIFWRIFLWLNCSQQGLKQTKLHCLSSCIVGELGNTGLCLLQKAVKRNDVLDADFVELIDPGRFEDEHGLDKRSVRLLKNYDMYSRRLGDGPSQRRRRLFQ